MTERTNEKSKEGEREAEARRSSSAVDEAQPTSDIQELEQLEHAELEWDMA